MASNEIFVAAGIAILQVSNGIFVAGAWCCNIIETFISMLPRSNPTKPLEFNHRGLNSIIVGPADPCYRPWCLQQVLKFSSQRFHVQIPQNHSNSIIVGPTDPCCRPWCLQQGVEIFIPHVPRRRGAGPRFHPVHPRHDKFAERVQFRL